MSMQPKGSGEIPAETMRVARAAFPKGCLAIRLRDELGQLFSDEQFAGLFPVRGRPAWSPGRLAMVLVLQFVESLTDRQAAEAVRARIDWKYALGLELADCGFDFSVLSEFRDRLVEADEGRGILDTVLIAARDRGLVAARGRARTDSTHVLLAVRELNQLGLVEETLRAALNAVALVEPGWLSEHARPEWFKHYATRADDSRFPRERSRRDQVYRRIGGDGMHLLRMIWAQEAPSLLRTLPETEVLRQVWVQHFHMVDGEVARRGPKDRPPGATRLVSPYELEARNSVKGDIRWDGYKVHVTETCDPDAPHLVTSMVTTVASVSDDRMAAPVHAELARRGLLPREHWVDRGYANGGALAAARRDHHVDLHGPLKQVTVPHARGDATFGQDAFTIDWDNQQVTCPNGAVSTQWAQRRSEEGLPTVRVRFSPADCRPCPQLRECVNSARPRQREINLRPRDEYEVLKQARTLQATDEWKDRYKIRAGVEGTVSQAVHACDLRRSRYRGLAKTSLQHQLTGAALNLIRINAWLTDTPQARTRTSPLTALRPAV
ncbi:IS1182 family transposase [Streptomyces sp. NPDC058297]|uniref:IS1182 family transposase n=1 Tax=Streptomyces sp. NPDC058297 TaxID=3346433 RepID=UPI0036E29DF5